MRSANADVVQYPVISIISLKKQKTVFCSRLATPFSMPPNTFTRQEICHFRDPRDVVPPGMMQDDKPNLIAAVRARRSRRKTTLDRSLR